MVALFFSIYFMNKYFFSWPRFFSSGLANYLCSRFCHSCCSYSSSSWSGSSLLPGAFVAKPF